MKTLLISVFSLLALMASSYAGSRYPTLEIAKKHLSTIVDMEGKTEHQLYHVHFWDYDKIDGPNDFAKLTEADRKWVSPLVGDKAFFLHRYIPKEPGRKVVDVLVDPKTLKVYGHRIYERPEDTKKTEQAAPSNGDKPSN